MTIRRLRTLIAIADKKTFSAAADVVHVTHAAISQQMQSLESDLAIALFDRSTRTPELTPDGHKVVLKARNLVEEYDNLVPMALGDGGLDRNITLGAIRTTLTGLTPKAMSILKSKFPELRLRIRPGLTGALFVDIERAVLDAAIVIKPNLVPSGLTFRELAKEPMQLITSMDETELDPLKLLRSRPFIRYDRNTVVGTLIDNWLSSKRIQVSEAMELDSPEAIASMVHAGLGVSIVPDLAVKPVDAVAVRRIGLGAGAPYRTLGLIHRQNEVKKRAINELFSALSIAIQSSSSD
ncbi:MAG TPA: LysR family transcriptional regulator [Rhodobacteraceae bacterium]|jgi:DNA-binding transcriptional LysR family regulator|uniref:LysR family transcriptional regulator n=1 Tax=Planktotalea sp. TaxID=2029877 RepID=UPI000183AA18|nr:LysR family transcriptional regulator [Planktotalea sp.]EDZ41726.1 transcriptional regulator, LysR family [Rhodobacteraceae bacterium HTCC2083]MDG1083027.1 LysR family transcriptional regulator [Planktotalea sp.]HCW83739.1 LysR family transcriptional regulator [Paracoccaceae bacterium]